VWLSGDATGVLRQLENLSYDARVKLSLPRQADPDVVLVVVDEKSIETEGRWPWPRQRLGDLIATLFQRYQIGVLGLDMQLPKESTAPNLEYLDRLTRTIPQPTEEFESTLQSIRAEQDQDRYFADQLAKYPVVLAYAFALTKPDQMFRLGVLPPPTIQPPASTRYGVDYVNSYTGNLKRFQDSAIGGAGHTRPAVDADGVIRRVPLLVAFEDGYYEAFALALARAYLQHPELKVNTLPGESARESLQLVSGLAIGTRVIPTDSFGFAAIPYRGPARTFTRISASDVLKGDAESSSLRGKIVLLGVVAQALGDLKITPAGKEFPGVEIHANLVAGVLRESFLKPSSARADVFLYVALATLLLLAIAAPFCGPWQLSAITLALLLALLSYHVYAWTQLRVIVPFALPLVALLSIYLFNMAMGYFGEARAFRLITDLFGQYVPKDLVKQMAKTPGRYTHAIEGDNREMTVLFADVRNFTTVSEKLTPAQLKQMMNDYLSPITECIHDHNGVIDKYMGDAVMAFWGAPIADPNHAQNAVQAALAMQHTMLRLREEFPRRGLPALRIGIGINTGLMNVGDMGSRFRRAFTVLGDAVNFASRAEGLTKDYGVDILVAESVVNATPNIVYREVDSVVVKGKTVAVRVFEPIGLEGSVSEARLQAIAQFHAALAAFRAGNWQAAKQGFAGLRNSDVDRFLCDLYLDRIGN
jgi:adenylate cyclase